MFDVLQFCFGFFFVRFVLVVFQVLDVDKSGALTFVELREAFDIILKMNLSEEEFETAAAEMDKDSDGSVRFPEFKRYFVSGFVCTEQMCFCRLCIDVVSILHFFVTAAETFQKEKRRNHGEKIGGRLFGSLDGQSVAS